MSDKKTFFESKLGKTLAGIEYMGMSGVSSNCIHALMRLIQFGDRISRARILSSLYGNSRKHCLLLTYNGGDLVAIKSGFASGYGGEGPRTFSYALCLLDAHGTEIEEFDVDAEIIARIDASALTTGDLEFVDKQRIVLPPRWRDYIHEDRWDEGRIGEIWHEVFAPVIPYGIVDPRLSDLAIAFQESPDDKLLVGYRRLEDIVRKRTGIEDHGAGLFSSAFLSKTPKLVWEACADNEHRGRAQLFAATYMAYRNPRAHREFKSNKDALVKEFLLLNQLYSLEREAIDYVEPDDQIKTDK